MTDKKTALLLFAIVSSLAEASPGQVTSGGQFTVNQSVIATGGGQTSGGSFTINGTSGQLAAGTEAAIAPFASQAGFWSIAPLVAVSAVSIGGIVQTEDGHGVRNIRLTLTPTSGPPVTVLTTQFGLYHFDDIVPGQVYTLQATSKRFRMMQAVRVIFVTSAITDMNFIAFE